MKTIIAVVLTTISLSAAAQVQVNGYVKKDGTYVAPTMRSAPNNTQQDNYSTKGNINPYNGNEGTQQALPTYNTYTPPPQQPVQHVPPNRDSMYKPAPQPKRSW
ncbi:MAG: hypothetical protein WKG03_00210 [Telluria sp.]